MAEYLDEDNSDWDLRNQFLQEIRMKQKKKSRILKLL